MIKYNSPTTQEILFHDLLSISRNAWDARVTALSDSEKSELSDYASRMSVFAAELAYYLDYRGGLGCGDNGHDKALEYAERQRKRIRKALGYSYP